MGACVPKLKAEDVPVVGRMILVYGPRASDLTMEVPQADKT